MGIDPLDPVRTEPSVGFPTEGSVRPSLEPVHLLLPVAAGASLIGAASPIDDPNDAYWHVVVGDRIRATGQVSGAGDDWAWYDPAQPWTSSQWLSESAMSWLVEARGWGALTASTMALSALALLLLSVVILRRSQPRVGVPLAAALALSLSLSFQTRPGLFSLVAAIVLGSVADRVLTEGRLPKWWWVLPTIILWANLHGGWIVGPVAVGLAAALHWLRAPRSKQFLTRAVILVGGMTLCGLLTPLGMQSLTLPLVFQSTTSHLGEWQTTALWNGFALPLVVIMIAVAVAWARSGWQIPATEIVYTGVWVAFGLLAYRNVAIAAVLLAPLAARSLARAFPYTPRETSRREHRFLVAGVAALSMASASWVAFTYASMDPLEDAEPLSIAQALSERSGPVRVLNHYNTSGVLLAFGPPGIELGIDGRAERFGRDYIDMYLGVFALSGQQWQGFLEDFDPQVAVANKDQAIVHFLTSDWGWTVTQEDGQWLLLEPS